MRIEGNQSINLLGAGQGTGKDPVADSLRKQISQVKEELQKLNADKSIPVSERADQAKELTKRLNELNKQLTQHEMDKKREQAEKAAQKIKEQTEKTVSDKEKSDGSFSSMTIKAMAEAEISQEITFAKEGVRLNLSGEARALSDAIKREELDGGVSSRRDSLNELYGSIGKLTSEISNDLNEAGDKLQESANSDSHSQRPGETDGVNQDGKTDETEEDAKGQEGNIPTPLS